MRRLRDVIELAYTEDNTMATYVYETIPKDPKKKPRQFEVQQKMSDPPLTKDPETGEPVRRVITGGSGWVTHGASILSMNTRKGRR
jgi:predicted nucleic acid-binding Zn ribbon protein